jgi:NarL family two-component system sensor histidine kinase LiaS
MSVFKRFFNIQWKLAASYVLVTLLTVLVLEGLLILAANNLDLRFAAEWDSQSAIGVGQFGVSLLTTTLLLLPCMIPLGLMFGFVTAASFTRRLRRLTEASSALADGDLSRRVQDSSGDEIGQLARQFNAMAKQLEADTAQLRELAERNAQLAQQTQRLAGLEERHRLARELHDGVKQHLFGVNLATAAGLNLLDTDVDAARARLLEAREHSRQAQAEMQSLLNELRPAGLDERGLVAALTDYLAAFERQEGIETHWQADDNLSVPLTYEQALYRIAQEALTNVARHAQATEVNIELRANPESVILNVADNGQGFDAAGLQEGTTMGLQGMRERLTGLGEERSPLTLRQARAPV